MGLNLDAWWDEPEYEPCNTFHLRGRFIPRKLYEHDHAKLDDVVADLYRDDVPDPQDIGTFEWQTILAYIAASKEEIKDVQKRMGRCGADYAHGLARPGSCRRCSTRMGIGPTIGATLGRVSSAACARARQPSRVVLTVAVGPLGPSSLDTLLGLTRTPLSPCLLLRALWAARRGGGR
jgi:hypothetical protein